MKSTEKQQKPKRAGKKYQKTIEKYQQQRNELVKKRDKLLFDEMMADTDEAIEEKDNQ